MSASTEKPTRGKNQPQQNTIQPVFVAQNLHQHQHLSTKLSCRTEEEKKGKT